MSKNKVIVNFYKALQVKDEFLIHSKGEDFLNYLNQHSGSFKQNELLRQVLSIKWQKKDIKARDKAIVQSASNYISHFLKLIENNVDSREDYISNIKTGLADLKPSICRIDSDIDFNFIIGNTNIQQSSIQYKIVEALFYENSLRKSATKYELDHLTVPFLRTILESKIKSIIGVDILRDSKNFAIDLSEILKVLPQLKSVTLNKAYDPNILSMIMKWLNHLMHRNLRPESYILYQVLQYVEPMFKPGKIVHDKGVLFSINISVFTNDLEAYHSEIEKILNSKFSGCYIQWKSKEVSSIK